MASARSSNSSETERYTFAVVATCVGVSITLIATHWLEDFPLLILLTVIMASGLRGGAGPAILSTTLSVVAALGLTHHLAESFHIPRVNARDEVIRLVIFVFVATGISVLAGARRRAESERDYLLVQERRAREAAETASLAKDRFLATVSHELRNPLAAILGWTRLLRVADDEQVTARAIAAIERSARTQAHLVADLLDVSRIVTGKLTLDVHPTDLVPVIEAALDTVRPAADAKHIHLETKLDAATGPVNGDADRLQQIVWNLLANAVKFTADGGTVSVTLGLFNSDAELCIVDTGEGIAPELLPRLFEPFWQGEGRDGQRGRGLGLGLAIVRHLVELHGGTVAAHSQGIGTGALFRVTIPLMRADAAVDHGAGAETEIAVDAAGKVGMASAASAR
jgi:signal transduction histidine kinase